MYLPQVRIVCRLGEWGQETQAALPEDAVQRRSLGHLPRLLPGA